MTRNRTLAVCAAALAVIAVTLAGARAANAVKAQPSAVAVVDLQKVIENLKERDQIQADLKSKQEQLQQTAQTKRKAIQALQGDLDLLQSGTQAYLKKQEQHDKAVMEFQVWSNWQAHELRTQQKLESENLIHKIEQTIGQVAKERGYDVVLFKSQRVNLPSTEQNQSPHISLGIVAWSMPGNDLSDEVVQRMNNEYQAGK